MKIIRNEVEMLILLSVLLTGANGAKILGLFPMNAYSHHIQGSVLLKELALRGHETMLVSPIKEKDMSVPGYKQIHIDKMDLEEDKDRFYDYDWTSTITQAVGINKMGLKFTEYILQYPDIQEFLISNQTVDLIIMDMFLDEAFFGFAHHFNCKMVLVSTLVSSLWTNHIYGNTAPPSFIPYFFLNYTSEMTFSERLNNFAVIFYEYLYRQFVILPKQNELLHKYFPNAPDLEALMYSSSNLILVNTHISTNDPAPLMPNMIEVGGYHITNSEPLSKELEEYMDSAKDGVIYFAMGSNLKSKNLNDETKQALLRAFSKIKQRVLWKFEANLPNLPKNVKINKWLPQQAILNHTNTKAFISHGGLMSTIEAVYFGVPVIGLPVFADQKMNIGIAMQRGYALSIPIRELTENKILEAISEITNNPKYQDNASKRARFMHDRITKPLDTAVYWVEYVLRYNGAAHYRSAALKLYWFQYYCIDIVVFLIIILTICLKTLWYLLKLFKKWIGYSYKEKKL